MIWNRSMAAAVSVIRTPAHSVEFFPLVRAEHFPCFLGYISLVLFDFAVESPEQVE